MSKLYVILARDKPDVIATRMAKLQEHLAHTEAGLDRLAIAGPMRDEVGNICGSLLVVKAESTADARMLIEADPYFQADIWVDVQIYAFSAAAGDWVGGKTW
jgi:uncharacterized protein YciI